MQVGLQAKVAECPRRRNERLDHCQALTSDRKVNPARARPELIWMRNRGGGRRFPNRSVRQQRSGARIEVVGLDDSVPIGRELSRFVQLADCLVGVAGLLEVHRQYGGQLAQPGRDRDPRGRCRRHGGVTGVPA